MKFFTLLAVLLLSLSTLSAACAMDEMVLEPMEILLDEYGNEILPDSTPSAARVDWIDRMIDLGKTLYQKAGGKAKRAQYSGDIYVCKNFTVHIFRETRADFRIAEYPDVSPVIPDNLPSAQCKPYSYGFLWKDITAAQGNPFTVGEQFRYDTSLTYQENLALAVEMMRHVRRGDFMQMSADYYYGIGAHSAIMIADYDPLTDSVHWMDSNMKGKKVNGERYAYVQFDAEASVQWWAEAFCHKGRGATLYRLRDDIIYAEAR